MDDGEHLIQSNINNTPPCHTSHIGSFGTPEEAAQAYLQHWEKDHPAQLKKELKKSTGFKGVKPDKGRYQTECSTLFLQHQQQAHSQQDIWFQCDDCNKWRRFTAAAAHTMPDPGEEERWCCWDTGGLYTCEQEEEQPVVEEIMECAESSGQRKTSQPSTEQDAYLHPGCRISVSWQGESFKGTVLKVVGKGSRVKVLLDRTDEWEEHEHEVGVKDVKPLEGGGGHALKKGEMRVGHMMRDGGGEQLVRSERSVSGYKGVQPDKGRYQATCRTSPCHNNHLGMFDTPEEAAQAYLQHHQHSHSHHPATDTWFQCDDCNKWRRFAGDLDEEEQWCCKDSGGLYTCEDEEEVEEEEHQSTAVPGHRDVVGMQGGAIASQATAGSNMDGSEQRMKSDHPEEREKDRAPQGHQVQRGGKKRKHEHTSEVERSSEQLLTDNEALKRRGVTPSYIR